jgi:hypothetical protein
LRKCIAYLEKSTVSKITDETRNQDYYLGRFKHFLQSFVQKQGLEDWPDDELFVLIPALALGIKITVHQFLGGKHSKTSSYQANDQPPSHEIVLLNEENVHYHPLEEVGREQPSNGKSERISTGWSCTIQ